MPLFPYRAFAGSHRNSMALNWTEKFRKVKSPFWCEFPLETISPSYPQGNGSVPLSRLSFFLSLKELFHVEVLPFLPVLVDLGKPGAPKEQRSLGWKHGPDEPYGGFLMGSRITYLHQFSDSIPSSVRNEGRNLEGSRDQSIPLHYGTTPP